MSKVKSVQKRQKVVGNGYSVVKFNDKRSTMFECISDIWFVDKHRTSCYFPPRTGKAYLLRVLSQEKPQGWRKYDCVIVSSGHATYNKGYEVVKEKCAQKFNTSSANENEELLRHHRNHPVLAATKAKIFENLFTEGKTSNQGITGNAQKKKQDGSESDEVSTQYRMAPPRSPLRALQHAPRAKSNDSGDSSKSRSSKVYSPHTHSIQGSRDSKSRSREQSISPRKHELNSYTSRKSLSKSRSRSISFSQLSGLNSQNRDSSDCRNSRRSLSKSRSRSRLSGSERSNSQRSLSKSRSRYRSSKSVSDSSSRRSRSRHSISARSRTSSASNRSLRSRSKSRSLSRSITPAIKKSAASNRRSNSRRPNSLRRRVPSPTQKPKMVVAASGSIFGELRELKDTIKENNQRIAKNDRRLTRMEVTINKVFVMVSDLKNAINSSTSKTGASAVVHSNEVPRGFKIPDLPLDEMAQLVRINRNLRDGQFR